MPKRTSTVRGREFGAGVREAIRRAGLSGRAAAELVGWDEAKLSDLVNGKGGVTEVELSRLLGVCRTPVAEHDHLLALFREANKSGWLQLYGDQLPAQLRTLIEHETAATEILSWSMDLVPGLLQIPDYMRAVIAASPNAPDDQTDERIAARVARKRILEHRREFTFFIHEQALRLPVGGSVVMSDQLHHLLEMSVRPYITLRIVSIAAGAHAGAAGSFFMMKFSKLEPVVLLEGEASCVFLDDRASAEQYRKVLAALDRTALGEAESKEMIASLAT